MRWGPRCSGAERLRTRIAELLGAAPGDVALTTSTSTGIQAVALDFPWRRGDRVVLLDGEFPANETPWQQAAALFGLEIAFVPVAAFLRSEEEGLALLDAEHRATVAASEQSGHLDAVLERLAD